MISQKQLQRFIDTAKGPPIQGYDRDQLREKTNWHRQAGSILRVLADFMGLIPSQYQIRTNMGGPAISGETTLHGERIYIQFGQFFAGDGDKFLYRSCNGRKDYTGGMNHYLRWDDLLDLKTAAEALALVMKPLFEVQRELKDAARG